MPETFQPTGNRRNDVLGHLPSQRAFPDWGPPSTPIAKQTCSGHSSHPHGRFTPALRLPTAPHKLGRLTPLKPVLPPPALQSGARRRTDNPITFVTSCPILGVNATGRVKVTPAVHPPGRNELSPSASTRPGESRPAGSGTHPTLRESRLLPPFTRVRSPLQPAHVPENLDRRGAEPTLP